MKCMLSAFGHFRCLQIGRQPEEVTILMDAFIFCFTFKLLLQCIHTLSILAKHGILLVINRHKTKVLVIAQFLVVLNRSTNSYFTNALGLKKGSSLVIMHPAFIIFQLPKSHIACFMPNGLCCGPRTMSWDQVYSWWFSCLCP